MQGYPNTGEPNTYLSPLTVLRYTSQVCKRWRELTLNSPSLWAQIIYLDGLRHDEDEWRDVVLQRTGKALLFISGNIKEDDIEAEFLDWCRMLLYDQWERIQQLDIFSAGRDDFVLDLWAPLLTRPAKNLLSFILSVQPTSESPLLTRSTNLFSGDAPLLRELSLEQVNFNTRAPLLTQLSTLWISYYEDMSPKFALPQVFAVVSAIPRLRSLALIHVLENATTQNLQPLSIPSLHEITIIDSLIPCLEFLDNMTPQPGCKLYWDSWSIMLAPGEKDAFLRLISQYSLSYFNVNPSTNVFYYFLEDKIKCGEIPLSEPCEPTFYVEIVLEDDILCELTPQMFGALRLGNSLPNISTLDFEGSPFVFDYYSTELVHLLCSFPSLQTLVTGTATFRDVFTKFSRTGLQFPALFSTLGELNIYSLRIRGELYYTVREDVSTFYYDFLAWRRNVGVPIRLFNLTMCTKDKLARLRMLEDFKGLEVIWKGEGGERSYICGSGHPEVLDFNLPPWLLEGPE
ncbi:hypothetical protein NLJ89_g9315 [Agrocybe chaxingu]|uniref:F-box domain-containing protein n=1 Tax=Agrocybe chaxingu TaxID=84603 RepID=A0A9W8JTA9_9AGAR|nr:hypothetical protein NLJ89_g9315 [Agrocybe chaxingu]